MVVGIDTGVCEAFCLAVSEETETSAHLKAGMRVTDRHHRFGDVFDVRVTRTSTARHQAHPRSTGVHRPGRSVGHDIGTDGAVGEDPRFGAASLRAVVAVLRAQPRLEVDQEVHLDDVVERRASQFARCDHRRGGVGVVEREHRQRVEAVDGPTRACGVQAAGQQCRRVRTRDAVRARLGGCGGDRHSRRC